MITYVGGLLKDRQRTTKATDPHEALAGVHKYKLKPPTYNGDYGTFEEWKYKFQTDMGLQHGHNLMRN